MTVAAAHLAMVVPATVGAPPPPPPPPPPPGTWPSPVPSHTGISTWVKIDTTSLWTANGGTLSGAQTLTIDGANASALYGAGYPGEPTVGTPIVTLLMSVGTHIIALGTYNFTLAVYWRGWPWKALLTESAVSANAIFFNGAFAGDSNIPGPGNSWGDGAAWQNMAINNNGYGMTLDPGPASSATFIVAPGDEGFVITGTPTADTRAEPNITDLNYIPVDGSANDLRPIDSFGNRNLDLFGNTFLTLRVYRFDALLPSSYTAGVTVQNASNAGVLTTLATDVASGTPITSITVAACPFGINFSHPVTLTLDDGTNTQTLTTAAAVAHNATTITINSVTPAHAFSHTNTNVKIQWSANPVTFAADGYRNSFNQGHRWPDGATLNPATGTLAASAQVTNTSTALAKNSNLQENQGPADFVWFGGTTLGGGSTQYRYQPTSLGIGLTQLTFDTIVPAWDTQYSTIVEHNPHLFATTNGTPWILSDPTDSRASVSSKHASISATGTNTTITGTGFAANMVGTQWGIDQVGAGTIFTVATFVDSTHITMTATVPAISGATMFQLPIALYGVPPGTPGGGWLRIWRRMASVVVNGHTYTNCWRCITDSNTNAVSGNTPVYDDTGTILNTVDGPFNPDSGKIFGPTLKCQGAKLATTMTSGTTGNITLTNVQGGTGFRPTNGGVVAFFTPGGAYELATFSSYSGGTMTITHRGILGTSAASHAIGDQVAGLVDVNVLSPGINQDATVPTPFCAREWPPEVGPTLASMLGPPLT